MKEVNSLTKEELYKELKSSPKGLTEKDAKERLNIYGKNLIKRKKKFGLIRIFFSQFNSFLIYILIVAAAISFLLKHNIDGYVISGVVLVNALIGFFQQHRAERSIQKLKGLVVQKSKVMRDGRMMEVFSEDLVPGDIVVLGAGDKIPADLKIIELENLEVIESILTGESMPILKKAHDEKIDVPLQKRKDLLFMGTSVVKGSAKAMVMKTGMKTLFGEIAEELQEINTSKTPIQKRLDKFSKQVGFIILGMVLVIALLGLTDKFDLVEMFLVSVALAVSAIPSGLPAVLTISFAISSMLMSKKNVVIRRLPAVESLGSVTVICSDKTGTLTEEKMNIEEVYSSGFFYEVKEKSLKLDGKKIDLKKHKELIHLLKTGILCNNSRYELFNKQIKILGDPTENSLLELAMKFNLDKKNLSEENPSIKKLEFDSDRKMMSVLRDTGKNNTLYTKGALTKVLLKSKFELRNGQIRNLTEKRKKEIINRSLEMENKALRVLALAYKPFPKGAEPKEKDLIFLGFVGMIDPPRKEVKKAISECIRAGIDVKIITGDSELTAKAICEKIGIEGRVVNDLELENMSDEELKEQIKSISIFARVTPKQKLRITKILQELGETVAITGDGVNDVLALKSADVGVAMGKRGTDVSREVSDIILIDDNFASIVEGVKKGRVTYDNVKKFTKYILSVNFAGIFVILTALLLGFPLPMLPLQILLLNLLSDSFASLALVFEKEEDVMNTKPRKEKSLMEGIWQFIVFAGIVAFLSNIIIFILTLNGGMEIERVRTLVVTTAIIYELFFVYTVRSKESLFKIGIFSNKWLNYSVLFTLLFYLLLIYTPLGNIFELVPLTLSNWLLVVPFAFSGLIIFEIYKLLFNKKVKSK